MPPSELLENEAGWWDEREKPLWHGALRKVVQAGPVPRHVAFVMDGNRRFARSHGFGSVLKGHVKGFEQLAKILEWCQELNIEEVTVYAFSIENFKRSDEEVNGLMELAERKFARLLEERDKLEEKQIRFRFFGDIAMLSPKLRKLVAQIELFTKDYKRETVNVCMPYTSRNEMARAFELIRQGRQKGLVEEDQITSGLISRCLDSRGSPDPELLIRTSGEKRLSDFLLWQCSSSYLHFDDVMWPEFGFWNLCKAIFSYQYHYRDLKNLPTDSSEELDSSVSKFIEWVDKVHEEQLLKFATAEA